MLAIAAAEALNASDRTYLDAVMTPQQADSTRSHSRSRPQSELYTRLLWTLGRSASPSIDCSFPSHKGHGGKPCSRKTAALSNPHGPSRAFRFRAY